MPEIPDIHVFASNLKKIFVGRNLSQIKVVNGKKLKNTEKELNMHLKGKILKDIYRCGKELRWLFSNGDILGMHLMLTGDAMIFKKLNSHEFTIVELYFSGNISCALTDMMRNANVTLNPTNTEGIDALDKKLNFKSLKEILNRKTNIKNVLRNQALIRGIGNAYSDEILWKSGISPFSIANTIPDLKIKELARNIKTVLKKAILQISKVQNETYGEVKEFLQIHSSKKQFSPTGAAIKFEKRGSFKTYYTDEQKLYN
ncbi:MAG: DNA-formamidopyrimidine glycosylase family protein [Ginsengibacter sp.]